MTDKFDFQKIINDVKSMVTPPPIPEANKSDPVGYFLSELNKLTKDLAENHTKQADTIAKFSTILGTLYQEIAKNKPAAPSSPAVEAETTPKSA